MTWKLEKKIIFLNAQHGRPYQNTALLDHTGSKMKMKKAFTVTKERYIIGLNKFWMDFETQ